MVNSRIRRDVALLTSCLKAAINKSKDDYGEDYCRYPEWEDAVDKGRTIIRKIDQLEDLLRKAYGADATALSIAQALEKILF